MVQIKVSLRSSGVINGISSISIRTISSLGTLINTETQNLILVDLNCVLHANAVVLSEWYSLFGNKSRSQYYKSIANKLIIAIDKVRGHEAAAYQQISSLLDALNLT